MSTRRTRPCPPSGPGGGPLLRTVLAILAALALVVVVSACGSSDSSSTSATGSSTNASASAGNDCASKVKAMVAQEKAPMEPIIPDANVDMSKVAGKTIWYISPSQATGYALALSKTVKAATDAAGLKLQIFDGKGQPDRFTQGLEQAVAQKAGGIILYGIDPGLVPNGLKAAKAANIPVLSVFTGKPAPADGSIFESINEDNDTNARQMARYAASITDCKVNAAVSFDTTYPALVTERDVIKDELGKLCPDTCKVQDHAMKLATMATDLGPSVQSLLQRNQDINVIFATFDQAATYEAPAVQQSGSKAKIIGTNGLPPNIDSIRKGGAQVADVSYVPPEFMGWLSIDQLGRAMTGAETGENGKPYLMPVQTFDKENVGTSSDFASLFPKLADYQSQFTAKWGV